MSDLWTRRRQAVAAEARAEEAALQAAERAKLEAAQAEKTDEELLAELGLPDPDTLMTGDDFKRFLTETVPARIKTRALRRLWRVNPALANLDGLVDYGEDFTDSATVVENLQTAYQVGKGMLKHVEELARKAELEAEAENASEEDTPVEDAPEEEAPEVTPEEDDAPIVAANDALPQDRLPNRPPQEEVEAEELPAYRPMRRMTFTFDAKEAG